MARHLETLIRKGESMNLTGTWVVDKMDKQATTELGDVLLEFGDDRSLIYTIRGKDKNQIINLRYQIDGATIITNQPSAPRVERTDFSLSDDGVLTLAFGGTPYRFRRNAEPHRSG